ncbi:MAG: class I adenylate-forming enzyme family protein, partial [Microthrixaceae bacterium]
MESNLAMQHDQGVPMTVARLIEGIAERLGDKVAFLTEDDDVSMTFSEVDARASSIAGGLRELGVQQGDRVALMAGSTPEFVATVIGTWKLGAILVALNAQLGPEEILYQLDNSAPRVVVTDPGRSHEVVAEVLARASSEPRHVSTGQLEGEPQRALDLPGSTDATIFYTSGTTGVPKGATHTHNSLTVQIDAVRDWFGVTEDDVFMSVLPIYLLSILVLGPMSSLLAGATCRLMPKYES